MLAMMLTVGDTVYVVNPRNGLWYTTYVGFVEDGGFGIANNSVEQSNGFPRAYRYEDLGLTWTRGERPWRS